MHSSPGPESDLTLDILCHWLQRACPSVYLQPCGCPSLGQQRVLTLEEGSHGPGEATARKAAPVGQEAELCSKQLSELGSAASGPQCTRQAERERKGPHLHARLTGSPGPESGFTHGILYYLLQRTPATGQLPQAEEAEGPETLKEGGRGPGGAQGRLRLSERGPTCMHG